MPQINWSYVAGFFDGEGTVNLTTNNPTISMCQGIRDDMVIIKIREFLEREDIHTNLVISHNKAKPFHLSKHTLYICDHISVVKALTSMMPWLIVKRTKAEMAIASMGSKQWRRRVSSAILLYKAYDAYMKGMSKRQAAEKYDLDKRSLYTYIKRYGLKKRSASEALKLWHAQMSTADKTALSSALSRGWVKRRATDVDA